MPEECRRADPMTPADLRRRHPSFLFLQDRNDLLFVEPASFHIVRLLASDSTKKRSHFRGARQFEHAGKLSVASETG